MKDIVKSSPLLQMGWVVAFSVLAPLGVGLLLDRRFGTAPLFIIVGALIGILASTVGAVRVTNRAIESLAQAAKENGGMSDDAGPDGATADGDDDPAASDGPVGGKEDRA